MTLPTYSLPFFYRFFVFLLTYNRGAINMFEPADPVVHSWGGGHVFKRTLQSPQMEISALPLKRCFVGEAFPGAGGHVVGEGGGKHSRLESSSTSYACFSLEAELPEPHTNRYTWLWLPWIPGPSFSLFLSLHQQGSLDLVGCDFFRDVQ